jgi:hypothetical protein
LMPIPSDTYECAVHLVLHENENDSCMKTKIVRSGDSIAYVNVYSKFSLLHENEDPGLTKSHVCTQKAIHA